MNRFKRTILYVVGFLYLATWTCGVPAVYTDIDKRVSKMYQDSIKKQRIVNPEGPKVGYFFSVALLPFITVNYYDFHIGPLFAWKGISVDFWYIIRTRRLFAITESIS